MPTQAQSEQEFLADLAAEFRDDGFDRVDPALLRNELPAGYTPDLVMRRGQEVVVIELKSQHEHRSLEQMRSLKQVIEVKPNWKFKLYVIPESRVKEQPQDNLQDIGQLIKRAKQLNRSGEFEAAAVVLWMAIEVSLRSLLTERQSRPNPGVSGMSMARSLTDFGEIGEDELRLIENAWEMRNRAVHGFRLSPREALPPALIRLAQCLAEKARAEGVPGR